MDALGVGDEVKVTLTGVVKSEGRRDDDRGDDHGYLVVAVDGGTTLAVSYLVGNLGATIEVTRAADHPTHDLPGTVRGGPHPRDVERLYVKTSLRNFRDNNGAEPASKPNTWWDVINGDEVHDDDVVEYPVLGVMPGSEAARPRPSVHTTSERN